MKKIRGIRQEFSVRELDGLVTEAIEKLKDALEDVPEEYRDTAYLDSDIDVEYGSPYCLISVKYVRPETKEEKETRELRERDQLSIHKERERRQYEELKKKFEQS